MKEYKRYSKRMRDSYWQFGFIRQRKYIVLSLADKMYKHCGRGIALIDLTQGFDELTYLYKGDPHLNHKIYTEVFGKLWDGFSMNHLKTLLGKLESYNPQNQCLLLIKASRTKFPFIKMWSLTDYAKRGYSSGKSISGIESIF
jgi:hypothetical protein